MSNLTLATISGSVSSGNKVSMPEGHVLYAPGHIIQVVNTYQVDPYSLSVPSSYSTLTDLPGLAATITPKSTSSKIYIIARWFGEYNPVSSMGWSTMFNIKRNGSAIGLPPQPGSLTLGIAMASIAYYANDNDSTPEMAMFDCIDSPASTTALTYQICVASNSGGTMFVNRCVNATTSGAYERGTSSITLMEIAA